MKCLLVLCIALTVFSAVKSEEGEFRTEYCRELPKSLKDKCVGVKCNLDNTKVRSVGMKNNKKINLTTNKIPIVSRCPVIRCVGKPIRYEEDRSKPYPGCCRKPICKE
ncbi:hypothetical protein TSAR_006966 [Trichomalopsis sarcophagae]|uniref:Single domain-containing protein n=1 Tax=Trichomalopsis sarcophagae TaxID=543379 RepID=A0A232FBE3_9HYME|nr:hypothetical protein TSAR_006966 [Trichomalopsis sarcophagae]